MQVTTYEAHVDGSLIDLWSSWVGCARPRCPEQFMSFLGAHRLVRGSLSFHIVHRVIHIWGELRSDLPCSSHDDGRPSVGPSGARHDAAVAAPGHFRGAELLLLIRAVSSVTWLKIARRSFMSSLIFLFACITVV